MRSGGIGAIARRTLHASLHWLGFDLVRYDARRFPELRRAQVMRERRIDVVLDVGANDGSFARGLRAAGYAGRIVSFEPQSAAFAALEHACASDPAWECRRLALASSDGEAALHLAANSSSSSLLEMTQQHVASSPGSRYVDSESVLTARLDAIRAENVHPADRIYLKVDVQGSELDVLSGAEETLGQVVVVDAELSFVPLYEGAPLFAEVFGYLEQRGFALLSLDPVFVDPSDGRLLQVDGMFARPRD